MGRPDAWMSIVAERGESLRACSDEVEDFVRNRDFDGALLALHRLNTELRDGARDLGYAFLAETG